MKRTFVDLHLRVNFKDLPATQSLLNKAASLGYKMVAVSLPFDARGEEISRLRSQCRDFGLDFASRTDLRPRSQNELVNALRRLRRRFEIIAVQCENKDVSRHAAKDRRVDLLNFPNLDFRRRFFDRAEAELASSSLATLEIDIKPLLVLKGPQRIRFLSVLNREVTIAKEFQMPIVVSSGIVEPLLLRKPREVALLSSLFGLEGDAALDAISTNALRLVERNREKLESKFVAPGIRIIKQGADP